MRLGTLVMVSTSIQCKGADGVSEVSGLCYAGWSQPCILLLTVSGHAYDCCCCSMLSSVLFGFYLFLRVGLPPFPLFRYFVRSEIPITMILVHLNSIQIDSSHTYGIVLSAYEDTFELLCGLLILWYISGHFGSRF
jgi:hypothetical protein